MFYRPVFYILFTFSALAQLSFAETPVPRHQKDFNFPKAMDSARDIKIANQRIARARLFAQLKDIEASMQAGAWMADGYPKGFTGKVAGLSRSKEGEIIAHYYYLSLNEGGEPQFKIEKLEFPDPLLRRLSPRQVPRRLKYSRLTEEGKAAFNALVAEAKKDLANSTAEILDRVKAPADFNSKDYRKALEIAIYEHGLKTGALIQGPGFPNGPTGRVFERNDEDVSNPEFRVEEDRGNGWIGYTERNPDGGSKSNLRFSKKGIAPILN